MNALLLSSALVLLVPCRAWTSETDGYAFIDLHEWMYFGDEIGSALYNQSMLREEQFRKIVLGNISDSQRFLLDELLGNSIFAMTLDQLGLYESLPAHYKRAIDNGVLCEVSYKVRETTVKFAQYLRVYLLDEEEKREKKAAKEWHDIDCRRQSNPCFCETDNTLLYCAAIKLKARIEKAGVVRKLCEADIEDACMRDIQNCSSLVLRNLDNKRDRNLDHEYNDSYFGWDSRLGPRWDDFRQLCDTDKPDVEATIKNLYAANGIRWTREQFIIRGLFNGTYADIEGACAVEDFKNSKVGKCACAKETGLPHCFLKTRAAYFRTIGYLICDGDEKKLDEKKRPASALPLACFTNSTAASTGAECATYRKAFHI